MNKTIKARLKALEIACKVKAHGGIFISNGETSKSDALAMAELEEQDIDFLHIRILPAIDNTDKCTA